MSNRSAEMERVVRAQANAKVLGDLVPQIASHPKILTGDSEDSGGIDELKMTNMPAEMLFPYIYGKIRATRDESEAWADICDLLERGLPSINGGRANMIRDIAGFLGGGGSKGNMVLRRNSFMNRHFRGKPEFEEVEAGKEEE